jgi:hypothetical protein
MQSFFRYTPLAAALFMTACSTTPTMSKAQLSDTLKTSAVKVLPINQPISLAERTKAQAIGKMVVSSVVGSVAGSAGSANSPQRFQENIEFGQTLTQQLNQSLPDSYKVEDGKGADLALSKKLSDYFAGKTQMPAETKAGYTLSVKSVQWELAYISLLTSQDYALNYQFNIDLEENKDNKPKLVSSHQCQGSSTEEMPLEAWQASHYAAVDKSAEIIVAKCFNEYLNSVGLQ